MSKYAGLDITGGEEGEVVDKNGLADQVPIVNLDAHLPIIIIYDDHHTHTMIIR